MPENNLIELMAQADSLRMIQPEGSYEWFDEILPKARKLLQQIQREQTIDPDCMKTKIFNQVRDCCDTLSNWIRQLERTRDELEKQKGQILKNEMNRLSIHNGAYSSFRGFFGK
ncbi:hypothetical protein DERP_010249 [Dermatophagoides pteronyssinus]|uniref:Uncharacterized protein n=1 Tax=Dermatophagoides pteronyssinus TaxID=6956 RepID=A0ABQ8J7J9_DERPT|nr:hypothetical protein DERP_010249 [Dermatophagoides pteronyssinus]